MYTFPMILGAFLGALMYLMNVFMLSNKLNLNNPQMCCHFDFIAIEEVCQC